MENIPTTQFMLTCIHFDMNLHHEEAIVMSAEKVLQL